MLGLRTSTEVNLQNTTRSNLLLYYLHPVICFLVEFKTIKSYLNLYFLNVAKHEYYKNNGLKN